jgi:hypothetical protein
VRLDNVFFFNLKKLEIMNMSYCRFQNTLQDLIDCDDNLPNQDLSKTEAQAFAELVELCKSIASKYDDYDYFELIELSKEVY